MDLVSISMYLECIQGSGMNYKMPRSESSNQGIEGQDQNKAIRHQIDSYKDGLTADFPTKTDHKLTAQNSSQHHSQV